MTERPAAGALAPLAQRVLIVEDDDLLRSGLARALRSSGRQVKAVDTGEAGLAWVQDHDVLLTDVRLPGIDGMELMTRARAINSRIEVVMMTGYASVAVAVKATQLGARCFLCKPFDFDELIAALDNIEATKNPAAAAGDMARRGDLVGSSRAMCAVFRDLDVAAASSLPVLVTGETGTGKELCAAALHKLSSRRAGPFVAVNLAAVPLGLAESELFGHERGAFTGSPTKTRGRFALADQGTLFLDEVNSLPLELQPKLLRALETGEVWPLGGDRPIRTDVRLIAASNAPLEPMVQAGTFRMDLFYRINVLRIHMPPLRERPEDIPLLVHTLLRARARGAQVEISPEALSNLLSGPWYGNVRELANVLDRALARALPATEGLVRLDVSHFDGIGEDNPPVSFQDQKTRAMAAWTRATLRAALIRSGGNVSEAARSLQMGRTALIRLMRKHGIRRSSRKMPIV